METIIENDIEPDHVKDEISIIMRQTTYTKEEATRALQENKNIEKCIELFLEIPPKKEPEMSVNQKIFKNIRENM